MDKKNKTAKPILKKGKKSKKSKEDEKAAKAEQARLLMYAEIMEKTELSEDDISTALKEFNIDFPSGVMTKEEFLDQSEVGFLSESLFKAFDKEKKGTIDFLTFMMANNVTLSSPEDKLDWIFTAFDKDGGGTIDVDEIRDIVVGLFKMAGIEEEEELLIACITDIKKAVDSDGDGEITKEEFVKNALKSRFLKNMLKN